MAGTTSRRWAAVILAAAAVVTLTLTACGPSSGAVSNPAATNGGALGNVPPASGEADGGNGGTGPTSGTDGGGGGGDGGTGASQAPTYPSDAKSYGLEILKAWAGKNSSRLAQLVDANSVSQIAVYGYPNSQWTNYTCIPDPTYTNCTYFNATGDIVRIMLMNLTLGKPKAGSAVTISKTALAKDAPNYAIGLIGAWESDNYALMFVYSNATVVSQFTSLSRFPVGKTPQQPAPCPGATSKTCVEVAATPPGSRDSIFLVVDMSKISAAKPGGVTAIFKS